jgi:hypothetical protein
LITVANSWIVSSAGIADVDRLHLVAEQQAVDALDQVADMKQKLRVCLPSP